MEGKIYPIFPTAVMKFKFDREFTESEIDFINNCKKYVNPNHSNTTSKNVYCLDDESMKDIKIFCENALNIYLNEIFSPINKNEIKLVLTQSWLNYSKPNEYHHQHYHPNSIISGVFYINADKKIDEIEFVKQELSRFFELKTNKINDYNTYDVTFTVGKYDLLLFPSTLFHRVPPVKGNETRISLAFNSFFKGTIGNSTALTKLEL
jgi:uncharacterized protein (TIGR02466 family)